MRRTLRSVIAVALGMATAILATPGTASAAPTTVGYDVSYPQCRSSLPRDRAFAVVGVNGGLSTKANPCLASQLSWAWGSSGSVPAQPKAQLYLNTANPGEIRGAVTTWPRSGSTPYGTCDGDNSTACSWQYGWERAENSLDAFFTPAAAEARVDSSPSRYTWWLDVETTNTWQSGSPDGLARNRATLEGMTEYLASRGGEVGIYSTAQQWTKVVGSVSTSSTLAGRSTWLAGATSLAGARSNCSRPPLVPDGRVVLAQYVVSGLDRNYSCL
ncbi:MAG TPA: hypothetical protein VK402_20180 [Blastococcus sp.]|nr:hypothetical protein [Blastococcus sp.]